MPSFNEPPMERSQTNSYFDRYLQNVNSENQRSLQPLKPLSSSEVNLSLNINTPSKVNFKTSASPVLLKEKENLSTSFRSSVPASNALNSRPNPPMKNTSTQNFDISNYSKEELRYYEYLCRVGEIKVWIENVIGETLPSELELCVGDSLRNGVYLAMVTQAINSDLAPTVFPAGDKLQFKHTQNINAFFSLVEHVGVPDSFRFELQDLYNKKNLPQVFETLLILITMIAKKWPGKTPVLTNLSGTLSFSKEDIKRVQRLWPRIRDFKALAAPQSPSRKNVRDSPDHSGLIRDFNQFEPLKVLTKNIDNDNHKTPSKTYEKEYTKLETPRLASPIKLSTSPTKQYESEADLNRRSPIHSFRETSVLPSTPSLQYSPLKTTSLSYYSPSISRHLTYDTEFYLRRSQNRETNLQYYDAFAYSPSHYSPVRRRKMTESEFLQEVVNIQSCCKGSNTRFELYMQRKLLTLFKNEIFRFQSLLKAQCARKNILGDNYTNPVLQNIPTLPILQAQLRAINVRNKIDSHIIKGFRQQRNIERLQACLSGIKIRKIIRIQIIDNNIATIPAKRLQARVKGNFRREKLRSLLYVAGSQLTEITTIQSFCRGRFVRRQVGGLSSTLLQTEASLDLNALKGIIRGNTVRCSVELRHNVVIHERGSLLRLLALLQANNSRHKVRFLTLASEDQRSVLSLQGLVRGILVRYTLDLIDDIIEYNNIDILQAHVRSASIRSTLTKRSKIFLKSEKSIVNIQSKIRMYLQRSAYVELMQYPNPRLRSVRKFTHLLNNSGTMEELQNELEACQASLDSENMKRASLEKEIRERLDILDILEKFGLDKEGLILSWKATRDSLTSPYSQYSSFEKLFYLLQVNPAYWKILYGQEKEFVENNVYLTFTTVNERMGEREKSCFVRLLNEFLLYSVNEAKSINQIFSEKSQIWERLMKKFLYKEYPTLFSLFNPLLEYICDPKVDMDSNPYVLYEKIHGSAPHQNILPIEDKETKEQFIQNLRNLWHCIEMIAEILTKQFSSIPLEVRFLCTKIFGYAADKNADETDSLRCIAKVLIGCFISEYIVNRRQYGFLENEDEQIEEKIAVVLKSAMTVFSLRKFSGYYDPLNQYCDEIKGNVQTLLYSVFLDPSYEQKGEELVYTDMISKPPSLEILKEKAFEIVDKFREHLLNYPENDVILEVLEEATERKSKRESRIFLQLNPSAYRFSVVEDKMRKLYDQTKRAFIYMTQVEEIESNLYALATSTVLPEDEPIFKQLVKENSSIKNDPIVQHLQPQTYFSLKSTTLKRIYELENLGIINSRENKLQNILNDIANTIKNPTYALEYVSHELNIATNILRQLSENNRQLSKHFASIGKSIEKIIGESQRARNFVPGHKSTFSGIKSAYKKVQHKDVIEMEGLKFKWTTRQMYEKGVIRSITGERLGEQTVKVFGSSGPKFPDIVFKISTSNGAKFSIQLLDKRKGSEKRFTETMDSFTFHDLLYSQVNGQDKIWTLLNSAVSFNTEKLLFLIIETFFS
ncbi:hypothetical protein KAFR_0F01110 [Kazachstania africana CBS 2517]|uniref:Calponin-homology (CH) domain-containing protein n=1 Tax=Kazachstania africana (strain ATCC 22294 / BCRC 22015 / CBS 2517 / CECT 1963 / NBRC 1671 / NRRL Y-8276) TaxID=1071382 RepID=H2AWF7_KAZAF|nr:hypothetical protein KAFR_0F01110 [Kazachstania africana CBS 2517]CCF58707.1 hypothetical protein KAFR_0F01110 [Kazachstania africana CBS 2517]